MKTLPMFLFFINVSQHVKAVVVEVNEGERSVLLPCQYSGFIPDDDPTVMWTRSDLHPKSVHLHREGGDDLRGQNQRYSGRTSMKPDALDTGDFSLTLRKPTKTDSGNYTCSISDGREERRLTDIQLQVKEHQVEVKVIEGSDSVILPCKTTPDLPEDTTVEWKRSDPELMVVHVYPKRRDHLNDQDGLYRDRMQLNEDLLRTGDLSLTLKHPTERDSGGYIWLAQTPALAHQTAVLRLARNLAQGGRTVYKVEVDSGVESVQLICKTTLHLPKDAKVEWMDGYNRKVHVIPELMFIKLPREVTHRMVNALGILLEKHRSGPNCAGIYFQFEW
ncbi:polymeric immunoglobulin receptor-like [Oreochromis niloticus]|uniref:polymeric immunoglobulin receptor-like n=1 Tax=Oreochromis niloticus TaxID=8128 RepID=UPI000DF39F5A|nr:polymeric immunoglobulin receptor-like [Oreochromis niloticus]